MAYLVIVHVPYIAQTVSDNEKENVEKYEKDTKDDLDSNRADGCKSDLKKLNGDENIGINKEGPESSTEQADGSSLTDETEDITECQTSIHKEETVDATNVVGKNKTAELTENGNKTEEVDKSEAGEGSEISNKSEAGDESETGNKSETGDESDLGNKTETGDESETGNISEMCDESETGNKTETGDESETSSDTKDKQGENEENTDEDSLDIDAPLTPLFQKIPIHERVKMELIRMGVDDVDMNIVGNGLYMKFSFVQDDSQQCEQILNRLRGIGVGLTAGSSMSVFPSSLHESAKSETESKASLLGDGSPEKTDKNEEVDQKKSQFKKSVKSRLLVAQVVKSVTANALFTFDYLLLLILASIIACIGLAENSSVVLVASMLISPLMGPILAATFGQVIKKKDLRNLGLKSEIKGLALCLIVGFVFGIVSGGVNLNGAVWGSSDSWPTIEMKSRTSGSHPDTMKKKRKNLDENFDIPEYVWAKLKGVPVMWPVKKYEVDRDIQKIHVFVKADNAILTVGLSEIMPFPGDVSSMAENAKVKLKSKKETLKAFTSDMEWCLNEISQSNPKIIGDEVKPLDKPSHSFDAPCENTLFESSENEEEKSPRIVGDEVSPPEKPSHSFDATCEETHFESSETEEEKSPKIIGDEVNPQEKPSHSFDATCEETHFESSETEEEKIPKIIGDEEKPPEKPSHSFDATCEETHFESSENEVEKGPKIIGDEVNPPEKPSHSFDATCEETHFESLENKEEKSPKIIGDEVNPPEKPSHSFDATCEKTHFESTENEEEKSPKIIGDEVKPPEKPSHSFDATCEETHFESSENEVEKGPKIIGDEAKPPDKLSHSFDATCENTHFESSKNEEEKNHIQKMEVKETVSSDSEDNSYESENENDSMVDSDYIPDSNSDSNLSSCSEGFPFVAEKFVLRNTQLDNNNNLNHSPLGEGRNRQCVNLIAEHDESNSGQEESHCNVSETVSHVEHCPSDEEEDAECSVTNSSIQDCNEELHCERSTPVPEKNRLYSGFTKIYIKKPIINNNSESGRGYDCVHACVFCKHLRTNIQAHLQHHSEKPEIKEIKQLQRKALWTEGEESQKVIQKIKQLQDILRNKGDHRHNLSVVMKMNGELIIARRSKGVFDHREYGPCPQCLEWIRLKVNYNRHVSTCPKQANSLPAVKNVMRFIFNTNVCEEASKHLIEEVFPSMIRGKITETAQSDRAIVLLGEYHFMSNISNKIRRKNYTSYHMRLAARLLHLIRKELNMPKATMSQVLTTGNFDVFVKCSLEACGLDEDEELKHPSTAVKMGHDIAKLAAIKGCCAIKNRDEENRKEAYDFEFLVTKEWKIKVKKRASNVLQQRQFNKKVELPLPDDIAHLAAYLVKSLKEVELVPGPIAFNRVAVLAEARLLLYNRRRPLEVEVLDLHTYQKRSREADETDLSLREELTKLEKILLKTQELVEVRGKGNQRVPIILPKEVQEPLKYLADPHIRKLGGIKSSNNFLFANTGDGAIRPGDALNIVKYELDLRCPNRIVATKLRKHTATIAQGMLWAYSLLAAISPPEVVDSLTTRDFVTTTPSPIILTSVNVSVIPATNVTSSTPAVPVTTTEHFTGHCQPLVNNKYTEVYFCNVAHEAALLGLISLFLTLINICCIIVMGIVVLKIKEVAPKSAGVDTFWREDVQVARGYYSTAKGQTSKSLGKTFLDEYRKLQAQTKDIQKKKREDKSEEPVKEDEISEDVSLDNDIAAIEFHDFLQDCENSPDYQEVFSKLPNFTSKKFAEELNTEYEEAALNISNRLSKKPGIYLTDNSIRDKDYQRVYNTIHGPSTQRTGIAELRNTFMRRKAPSMFIESSALNHIDADLDNPRQSKSSLGLSNPGSKLFGRRKRQVKFQVTKVEEEQELV